LVSIPRWTFSCFGSGELSCGDGATAHICLVSDRFPDFELRLGDVVEQFEETEADRRGRRRGDEYWRTAAKAAAAGEMVEVEGFDRTRRSALSGDGISMGQLVGPSPVEQMAIEQIGRCARGIPAP